MKFYWKRNSINATILQRNVKKKKSNQAMASAPLAFRYECDALEIIWIQCPYKSAAPDQFLFEP